MKIILAIMCFWLSTGCPKTTTNQAFFNARTASYAHLKGKKVSSVKADNEGRTIVFYFEDGFVLRIESHKYPMTVK